MRMMALSILQPWAWLIVNGHKDIENRNWRGVPKYRGPLLIHTGRGWDQEGYLWVKHKFPDILMPFSYQFDRGGLVGQVDFIEVVARSESPWFFGPMGFVFNKQKPLPFSRLSGKQGLWEVDSPYTEAQHAGAA